MDSKELRVNATPGVDDEALRRLKKQQELDEFYVTYDPWTGIRTAIALMVFFVLTVSLICYKSKCKKTRKLELYPSLEDMPNRPLDYYDCWLAEGVSSPSRRKSQSSSLGYSAKRFDPSGGSAPIPSQYPLGSYISLNNSFRIKSLPGSVMRMNWSRLSSFEKDENIMCADFLRVPGVRLQSTGSSSDGSSSNDIPSETNSMVLLGIPGAGSRQKPVLQLGGMDWNSDHASAEWAQTIDINVIQPTPNISPCGSVRSVSESMDNSTKLKRPERKRANSVHSLDMQEDDLRSLGSDSVFFEESDSHSGSSSLKAPQQHKKKRQVHTFRLAINPSGSLAPIPPLLQGQPLKHPTYLPKGAVGLLPPLGAHLSSSCEKLAAHGALAKESGSQRSSTSSLQPTESIDEEPMCATFTVPNLRRCNSATTPEMKTEACTFRRADSATTSVKRADSTSSTRARSSISSSGSDDASDSVSFHLMVPQLSVDIPSQENSRASSPTLTPTPPTSPPVHEKYVSANLSPRTRSRLEGSRLLKRQYSQYSPIPAGEIPPLFSLPTYEEEDEGNMTPYPAPAITPPPDYQDKKN